MMTIYPYLSGSTWVFDDPRTGLKEEAFVLGASEMISRIVREKAIPKASQGFAMSFSDRPFEGYDAQLELTGGDDAQISGDACLSGNWYRGRIADEEMTCWLCPALLLYFVDPPPRIYVRAEPLPAGVNPIWDAPVDRQRRFVSASDSPQSNR